MHFFRGDSGQTAAEIAFEMDEASDWQYLSLEAAAWRGPGQLLKTLHRNTSKKNLYTLPNGRVVGRLRFEVPPEFLVLGLQVLGLKLPDAPRKSRRFQEKTTSVAWTAFGRDSLAIRDLHVDSLAISDIMLAYEIHAASGSPFDMGKFFVVPRVDEEIAGRLVHLYFEMYPPQVMLEKNRAVAVTYEIRALPPKKWAFWDQFKTSLRRRRDPHQRAIVQSTFLFVPKNPIETQQLTIDVSALEAGPYALEVILTDTTTGKSARRGTAFELIAAPPADGTQ